MCSRDPSGPSAPYDRSTRLDWRMCENHRWPSTGSCWWMMISWSWIGHGSGGCRLMQHLRMEGYKKRTEVVGDVADPPKTDQTPRSSGEKPTPV